MPDSLDCSYFGAPTRRGPTWRGLTVGVSTFEEVLAAMAPTEPVWSATGNLTFWVAPHAPILRSGDVSSGNVLLRVETCFAGGILSAMNIACAGDLRVSHDEWMAIYGRPDRVTWSALFCDHRALIWAEEGLLVMNRVYPDETYSVMLFPPMTPSELESSRLLASLPAAAPPTPDPAYEFDGPPPPGCEGPEDPWGIMGED